MDFNLTEEQRAIQEMVRQFAENEIAPNAHEWDKKEVFPRGIIKKMGELGFFGCLLPEEYGVTDCGFLSMCVITEQLAKVSSCFTGCQEHAVRRCGL
jgi:glutaryl-CoA dehydrogenase (non-decarboxylating)